MKRMFWLVPTLLCFLVVMFQPVIGFALQAGRMHYYQDVFRVNDVTVFVCGGELYLYGHKYGNVVFLYGGHAVKLRECTVRAVDEAKRMTSGGAGGGNVSASVSVLLSYPPRLVQAPGNEPRGEYYYAVVNGRGVRLYTKTLSHVDLEKVYGSSLGALERMEKYIRDRGYNLDALVVHTGFILVSLYIPLSKSAYEEFVSSLDALAPVIVELSAEALERANTTMPFMGGDTIVFVVAPGRTSWEAEYRLGLWAINEVEGVFEEAKTAVGWVPGYSVAMLEIDVRTLELLGGEERLASEIARVTGGDPVAVIVYDEWPYGLVTPAIAYSRVASNTSLNTGLSKTVSSEAGRQDTSENTDTTMQNAMHSIETSTTMTDTSNCTTALTASGQYTVPGTIIASSNTEPASSSAGSRVAREEGYTDYAWDKALVLMLVLASIAYLVIVYSRASKKT